MLIFQKVLTTAIIVGLSVATTDPVRSPTRSMKTLTDGRQNQLPCRHLWVKILFNTLALAPGRQISACPMVR